MITEQYVTFETAKMLKEAGFHAPVYGYWEYIGDYVECKSDRAMDFNRESHSTSRPTQALAARWLRDEHRIHVIVLVEAYKDGVNYLWQMLIYDPLSPDCWSNESSGLYGDNGEYKTHESALEAGLQEALRLIIKDNA